MRRTMAMATRFFWYLTLLSALLFTSTASAAGGGDVAAEDPPPPPLPPALQGEVGGEGEVDPLSLITIMPMDNERIKTAVPDVKNAGAAADPYGLDRAITEQLRHDLYLSGFFHLLPPDSYGLVTDQGNALTASTIDFEGWQLVNADYLIKGTYVIEGKRALLDLRLFDVVGGQTVKLKWKPRMVTAGNYQKAVHDFVNAMISFQAGGKGPLGSAVLFVGGDSGSNRKVHSLIVGNEGVTTYGVPRGINILPTWGRAGEVLFSTFGAGGGSELHRYDLKEKAVSVVSKFPGMNLSADYCASKDLYALTLSMDGDAEIYTMRPDGSELTRLTENAANDASPSWGPGCRQLAFVSNRDGSPQIFVMKANGSGVRRLTHVGNYNTTPEWSPVYDEKGAKVSWIAFTARDERNRFDIFIISPDGREIYRITQDQGNNEEPTWSSSGRYLVFQSTRDGRRPRLYMTRADTRGSFQVRIAEGFGYKTPQWQR